MAQDLHPSVLSDLVRVLWDCCMMLLVEDGGVVGVPSLPASNPIFSLFPSYRLLSSLMSAVGTEDNRKNETKLWGKEVIPRKRAGSGERLAPLRTSKLALPI